jgi:hypothetical protein
MTPNKHRNRSSYRYVAGKAVQDMMDEYFSKIDA